MSFGDDLVQHLAPQFAGAFKAMAAPESGAIANPDEGRMVGHYRLRDPGLAPTEVIRQAIREDLQQAEAFARQVHDGTIRPPEASRFTDLLSIGIGVQHTVRRQKDQFSADGLGQILLIGVESGT